MDESKINRRIVEKASEKYKHILSLNRNCHFYLGKGKIYHRSKISRNYVLFEPKCRNNAEITYM